MKCKTRLERERGGGLDVSGKKEKEAKKSTYLDRRVARKLAR